MKTAPSYVKYTSKTHKDLHTFHSESSAHPLHNHSYPTRRSSDLQRDPLFDQLLRDGAAVGLYSYRDLRDVAYSMAHKLNKDFRTDRKSTRLNSSHSQISYAVFCLKKNKILNYVSSGDMMYRIQMW